MKRLVTPMLWAAMCVLSLNVWAAEAPTPATPAKETPADNATPSATAVPAVAVAGHDELAIHPFLLGPEDVLSISVWREDGLDKETVIRPDGMLNFPLVGAIRAMGRTIEEVHDDLVAHLQRYIPAPVVSVSLLRIGSNRIFVIGEVNKPGAYVTGQYLDVMQALSLAGGFTAFADSDDIRILRRVDGQETVIDFDYDKVSKGRHLEQNILLKNGDVVVIP